MSATEDDTELRDLLVQNLENTGVLNKLKAEMRAAVFLAMEEQDKLENKIPLINENLKKCLNSSDGRLVASLILDFLQVFNLDFTLAVFQPEINSLNGLESRDMVCRELGLSESEVNRSCPLLLELVRRGRHKPPEDDRGGNTSKEPSQRHIAHARNKFDVYDKDGSGSVLKEDVKSVFTDLFPTLNRNMLDKFISDELRAADKTFNKTIDFQVFVGLYRRLFAQCRTVVVLDSDVTQPQGHVTSPEEKSAAPPVSKIPRFKGVRGQTAVKDSDGVAALAKGDFHQQDSRHSEVSNNRTSSSGLRRDGVDLDLEVEDDADDGDSFFDDPLPKPQKTYGWKVEASGTRDSPAGSLSEAPRPGPGAGSSSASEPSHSRNAASKGSKGSGDSKNPVDGGGSLHLGETQRLCGSVSLLDRNQDQSKPVTLDSPDDEVEYDDDFNSHRSDLSKSEISIGEEIEEVSIEGPDNSEKFDETTQDLSVSQLSQSHGADYMEDVA